MLVTCQAAIDAVAARLRIGGEFKFSGSRPEVRDAFFRAVLKFDFRVRAIIVKKERIYSVHHQSLDWIVLGDPRCMIAELAEIGRAPREGLT